MCGSGLGHVGAHPVSMGYVSVCARGKGKLWSIHGQIECTCTPGTAAVHAPPSSTIALVFLPPQSNVWANAWPTLSLAP